MSKDLYSVLGVSRNADAAELRRAYKRKAKELHPDLHPGDKAKAEAFKAASSAYEILGDEGKRKKYDRGEIDSEGNPKGFFGQGGGQQPFQRSSHPHSGGAGDPFEDILSGMFSGGRRRPGPSKGSDVRYIVDISFEDAVSGAKREMKMADGRVLNVSIPAGVESGQTLRLKSQGQPAKGKGPPGDALLEVNVRKSPVWTKDGVDLRMSVGVPLKTAVLGGSVDVMTPAGDVTLKIPEGSNTGALLRLRGKGVQIPGKPGNLYVRLEIMIENPKDPGLRDWARGR
ncbi:MAG: DnaJ C-terminal domain-containing protein [Henriciella sp.]|nr:DnaJ C-terminal domain-containing protein [Henriciella sp.]